LRKWVPIVSSSDALAASSWDAIEGIAKSVEKRDYGGNRTPPHEEALLAAYLARANRGGPWADIALERLNKAIEATAPLTYCGLYGGLCGIGWTVDHLSVLLAEMIPPDGEEPPGETGESGDEDVNGDIDTLLLRELQRGRWRGQYDLIGGLVGYGVYLLERTPAAKASLGVELLIYHLDKSSEVLGKQITWHTRPELLPPTQSGQFPNGYYNLGVAHGIPGVLHFLSEAFAAGIERDKTKRLLEGGMEWLIAQERPAGAVSRFSTFGGESGDARMAWCYGDAGIAAVLHQIGARMERPDWQSFADRIADSCLSRTEEAIGAKDAALCHGYAGLGHIFNRLYQDGGNSRYEEAARRFFELALALRKPEGGVGGFFSVSRPDRHAPEVSDPDPGFLAGATGIALALLAAVTPVEPVWDRLLLLSGREWTTES
jgi:hypothetical protein